MTWQPLPCMAADDVKAYEAVLGDARALVALVQDLWERAEENSHLENEAQVRRILEGARWRTRLVQGELVDLLRRLKTPTARQARLFGEVTGPAKAG